MTKIIDSFFFLRSYCIFKIGPHRFFNLQALVATRKTWWEMIQYIPFSRGRRHPEISSLPLWAKTFLFCFLPLGLYYACNSFSAWYFGVRETLHFVFVTGYCKLLVKNILYAFRFFIIGYFIPRLQEIGKCPRDSRKQITGTNAIVTTRRVEWRAHFHLLAFSYARIIRHNISLKYARVTLT